MAKGKTISITTKSNDKSVAPVVHVVEPIVVNDQLVADERDVMPGVNSATNKN